MWREVLSWQQFIFDPSLITTQEQYIKALANSARVKGVQDKPGVTVERMSQQFIADMDNALSDEPVDFADLFSIAIGGLQKFYEKDLENFIALYNDGEYDDIGDAYE